MIKHAWTPEEIAEIQRLYPTTPAGVLAKKFGVTINAVYRLANNMGLKRDSYFWSAEDEEILRRLYCNTSNKQLSKILGKSPSTIHAKAKKMGLSKDVAWLRDFKTNYAQRIGYSNRRYFFNESYFEAIDTPEKAYWLGFIQADGCIHKAGGCYALTININKRDIELLQQFMEDINLQDDAINYSNDGCCRVTLTSQKLYTDLISHGITPKKSLGNTFPTAIKDSLLNHFIRGVFDGDGCIKGNSSYSPEVEIQGNQNFCCWALAQIREMTEIRGGSVWHDKRRERLYAVRISGGNQVYQFYCWLYRDATRWLSRKRDKFEKLLATKITRESLVPIA